MAFKFTGKKFLVTGAGKGFGRAIALSIANAGGKVYALSRTQSTLDSLAAEHPDIVPITQDLVDWKVTRQKLEQLEVLDGLVNNAARVGGFCPAVDFPKDEMDSFMDNNLFSAINCTQVVAKKMVEAGRSGSIVNISSISSSLAYPQVLGYSMAKAALDSATKQFALELGPHNIRVNSIRPTLIITEGVKAMLKEDKNNPVVQNFQERTPMTKQPLPEDIIGPVLYLLSDASALVTGTEHLIDGGISCNITTKTKK